MTTPDPGRASAIAEGSRAPDVDREMTHITETADRIARRMGCRFVVDPVRAKAFRDHLLAGGE